MKTYISRLLIVCCLIVSGKSFAIADKFWGYCQNGKAYSDPAMQVPKPEADKVCKLPDAYALGETSEAAIRCHSLQESECQLDAGGTEDALGDHNVPRGAFFVQTNPNPGSTGGIKQMRCMCGCFTPDVVLDTTAGGRSILSLYEQANAEPFRLITPAEMFAAEYNVSDWITRGSFTIGPEEKPVWKFFTDAGDILPVTEKHPMVLNVRGEFELRIAREIKVGDVFIARDGSNRVVEKIEKYMLPTNDNLVYNLNTKGERPLDHLIVANGILVGDLYLQNMLNERAQRVENIQQASD